jgi:NADP-dependent 3-hydroxy acid dehydrogenase YdfG
LRSLPARPPASAKPARALAADGHRLALLARRGERIQALAAGVMLLAPFTSDQRAEHRQMVEVNLLGAMTATEVSSTNCARRAAIW